MKLPPYGKELRELINRGEKPWPPRCFLFFTHKWRKPDSELGPCLMVPPGDYEEGVYDFSDLAAVGAVHIFTDLNSDSKFLRLALEVAHFTAPVTVHLLNDAGVVLASHGFDMLIGQAKVENKGQWPAGWSDQLQLDYERTEAALEEYWAGSQRLKGKEVKVG